MHGTNICPVLNVIVFPQNNLVHISGNSLAPSRTKANCTAVRFTVDRDSGIAIFATGSVQVRPLDGRSRSYTSIPVALFYRTYSVHVRDFQGVWNL